MITRFDSKGEIHVLDAEEVVDVNLDKVARALLGLLVGKHPARAPRRLPVSRRPAPLTRRTG